MVTRRISMVTLANIHTGGGQEERDRDHRRRQIDRQDADRCLCQPSHDSRRSISRLEMGHLGWKAAIPAIVALSATGTDPAVAAAGIRSDIGVSGSIQTLANGTAEACAPLVPDLRAEPQTLALLSHRLISRAWDDASYCRAAAENGISATSSLRLGIALAAVPGRAAEARELVRRFAAGGNAEVCNLYGLMLSNGIGGEVDDVQTAILFQQAATDGVAAAMFNFGVVRWYGKGPTDRQDAVTWLERAVANGDAEAMSFLGLQLVTGSGIIADRVRGLDLIHRAIENTASNRQRMQSRRHLGGSRRTLA